MFLLNKRVFQKIKKYYWTNGFLEQTFKKTIVLTSWRIFQTNERMLSGKKNKIDGN